VKKTEKDLVASEVRMALGEDIGPGDITATLVPEDQLLEVQVTSRQTGVLAGQAWFDEVFVQVDPSVEISWEVSDSQQVLAGECLCRLKGSARSILTGERTALNFLQFLSGTATSVSRYVDAVKGTNARILDTRKTIPGLRHAQKYAVRAGGGTNHRMGLYDAILIKENHIAAAGSIQAVVDQARILHPGMAVEIEVERLDQLHQAVEARADRAMLDNFDHHAMTAAVSRFGQRIELEASGGINLENVGQVAATGVHFISIGEITKQVIPLDLSMRYV